MARNSVSDSARPSHSVYQIVTDQILDQLQRGVVPWRKPWTTQFPKSLHTLREYRGINVLLLTSQGYPSPYWLTYNQTSALGGHVKQGERSTLVTFWKRNPYKKRNEETGEDETRDGFLLRYYRVFNLCQTEGIADKLGLSTTGESTRVPSIDTCERIVAEMPFPPKREQSSATWYRPLTDTVGMPSRDSFHSSEEFYCTFFHELAHSTGHQSRVGRDGIENVNSFVSESYSREELVAEMSSAFPCGVGGISPATLSNSANYLQGWISKLRGDSRLLISAASHAQKAADYIPRAGTVHRIQRMRGELMPRSSVQSLSVEQIKLLLRAAREASTRDWSAFLLTFRHALRSQELRQLRLADIDMDNLTITISRVKGSRSGVQALDRHKGEPLLDEVLALRTWLRERVEDGSGILFPSQKGGTLTRMQLLRLFKRYACAAGIPDALAHPHVLRHSLCTLMAEQHSDVYAIQQRAGHKNITNTMIYTHVSDSRAAESCRSALMTAFR